jgi:DNA topoisomerase IB
MDCVLGLVGNQGSMSRLRHSHCAEPGYSRRRSGRGFSYLDGAGNRLHDRDAIERIRGLAIPPAWTDVWICRDANGHLQAVGTDDAGRRQYLYHPRWRVHRDRQKFEDMLSFAAGLPGMRRRVSRFLGGEGLSHDRVLACAIGLLDRGLFRIGSDQYANEDGGYGLATLERRHVTVRSKSVVFDYDGKTGKEQVHEIVDPKLWRVADELKRSRHRSARFLVYRHGHGFVDVHSDDINAFLKGLVGAEFSAKDFRTWHATVLAAVRLATAEPARSEAARKRVAAGAVAGVAESLGNTPAVCRASYIDPKVFDRFNAGQTVAPALGRLRWTPGHPPTTAVQNALEAAVLDLLDAKA